MREQRSRVRRQGRRDRRALYGPPENAIVICVDEKPSIQALERAQGYLKLANGRALIGHSHDYKRNGTTTFEVATGKARAEHKSGPATQASPRPFPTPVRRFPSCEAGLAAARWG